MIGMTDALVTPIYKFFDALLLGGSIGICAYIALMLYDTELKGKEKREVRRENLQMAWIIGFVAMVGVLMMLL